MIVGREGQILHVLVVDTIAAIPHVAVLQVAVQTQLLLTTVDDTPVGLGIGIDVYLVGLVAVVLIVNRQGLERRLGQIFQRSPVMTQVVVAGYAHLEVHRLRHILGIDQKTGIVVLQPFLVHTIALVLGIANQRRVGQSPVAVFLLLILLVVAASVGIMERGGDIPLRREAVQDSQLSVLLRVVVGLVGIIHGRVAAVRRLDAVFSRGIVSPIGAVDAIGRIVVHAFPAHAGLLRTAKGTQDHLRLTSVPADVTVVAIQVALGAIQKTVRVHLAEAGIQFPAVGNRGMGTDHLAEGVVHTAVKGDSHMADRVHEVGLHI